MEVNCVKCRHEGTIIEGLGYIVEVQFTGEGVNVW
jgi:hypothetical protein